MADIFISYASVDRFRVEPLAKALEDQGWSVWWDRVIPPGKSFDQVIQEAITAAKCVVVLWSKQSIISDWVKEEATIGKRRQILVPAKIDSVNPPLGFGLVQAADLTDWDVVTGHPGFASLLSAISDIVGLPSKSDIDQIETVQEERRIDAVAPSNASVRQSMNVFVQVRFPDSEFLSIEDWPFKIRPSSIELTSKSTKLRFSKNSKGKLVPAHLKFKIVAPEFAVEGEKEKTIKIPPNKFSERISFQLTPKSAGIHAIMVHVCDENGVSVGELPVETDVYEQDRPFLKEATIVVLSLDVLVLDPTKVSAQDGLLDETFIRSEPPELKPDSAAPAEPKLTDSVAPELGKTSSALKLAALAGIILLLIAGMWWWASHRGGRIFVESVPEHANVKILNIDKPFQQGIELVKGKYHVQVSLEGYETERRWIDLKAGQEETLKIKLAIDDFPTSRIEWDTKFLRPTKKGTWNVVVASISAKGDSPREPPEEVRSTISSFSERFPNVKFAYLQTVNVDGGNPWWAVIIGSGLKRNEAIKLAKYAKEIGIAPDAYTTFQNWDGTFKF